MADFSDWHPGHGAPLHPPGFVPQRPIAGSFSYVQRHPTRYEWRGDVEDYIRKIYRRYGGPEGIHINTYVCHPEARKPSIACRDTVSYDIWGPEGRGDSIGHDKGQKIYRWLVDDNGPPSIAWIIWNRHILIPPGRSHPYGSDPFSWHEDHIHLTATGRYRKLS